MYKSLLAGFILLLCACSTTSQPRSDSNAKLQFQSSSTRLARQAAVTVTSESLQPGDLLLSSSTSVQSWGIRLFTLTGVSHVAIYIGNQQVAEAVGGGVKIITLQQAIDETNNLVVMRLPGLTPVQTARLQQFSRQQQGKRYNFKGIVMFMPNMLTRRICEMPLASERLRANCLTALATVQLGRKDSSQDARYFCSEFVIDGFRYAGIDLLQSQPHWVSPADVLHLREGDISAWQSNYRLRYVGHLKTWDLRQILSLRAANRHTR
ncbi:YaeF family permuted papain-like enzyme [Pantoea sp. LMR881]|uniref:YaeF family permuted papain-like enzyme n=1 Tax=Pantoea sp. LMR881 TaxID=3014336 RepID=UPI0022AEB491|nr:YaeF family permuted papain-like enzyme [Pantoea sp. LMR881]MCZ4060394.1 YaeF family permuted papain-like enzyme [Pantoea sp. LMR881]